MNLLFLTFVFPLLIFLLCLMALFSQLLLLFLYLIEFKLPFIPGFLQFFGLLKLRLKL